VYAKTITDCTEVQKTSKYSKYSLTLSSIKLSGNKKFNEHPTEATREPVCLKNDNIMASTKETDFGYNQDGKK
jgi:hypothetical protein